MFSPQNIHKSEVNNSSLGTIKRKVFALKVILEPQVCHMGLAELVWTALLGAYSLVSINDWISSSSQLDTSLNQPKPCVSMVHIGTISYPLPASKASSTNSTIHVVTPKTEFTPAPGTIFEKHNINHIFISTHCTSPLLRSPLEKFTESKQEAETRKLQD